MPLSDFYMTRDQVAKLFGVGRQSVWRWLAAGRMSYEKIGREILVPKWEVELFYAEWKRERKGGAPTLREKARDMTDRMGVK